MPVGIVVAFVIGTASGVGALIVLRTLADRATYVVVTSPIEVGGLLASLPIAISTVLLVGRDSEGHLKSALALTPGRTRLYVSRCIAFLIVGGAVGAAVSIVTAIAGVFTTGGAFAPWAGLGVLLVSFAAAWFAVLALGIATIVRRGGLALLVLIGLLIVLPLLLGTLSGMLPSDVASLAQAVVNATPTPLFGQAIGVSGVPRSGPDAVLAAQAALGAWSVSIAVLAGIVFARRDA